MALPETYVAGFSNEEAIKKMPYKKLGKTGINISKLGFGGGSVSGLYDEFDDNEAIETIREAIKSGVNYVDTAPFYGQGRSETVIGKALKGVPRKAYYLSTKVGRYTKKWDTMFDYSAAKITSSLDESMKLLGVDYVDIVVVHDVEFADSKQILEETLPAVKKLVESGKARFIAISGYPLKPLCDIINKSQIPIDIVLTYSRDTLIDKTLQDYIPIFKEKNLGIINAAPTALAMLTNAGPQPWHPANSPILEICAEAAHYCVDHGVELGRLAVFHTMKNNDCHNFLIGNNNRTLLRSNLELAIKGLNTKEQEVLNILYQKYFTLKVNLHWEGIELAQYKLSMMKEADNSAISKS